MTEINTATVETNTVKLTRNERRKLQRAAKKANVSTISEIAGTVEGILGDRLEGGQTVGGTVDSQNQQVGSTDLKKTEEVNEEKTSDRGRTTKIIIEMMQSEEGTTREAIIAKLKETFPDKKDSAIKNTVGALMHVIPQRLGWKVEKTPIDEKDKRKMLFRVVGKVEAVTEEAPAAAEAEAA